MAGEKITCATCVNEENRQCSVKKATVAINKRRRCEHYKLEAGKVKAKQVLKTVRMGHREKEALRREYKEQLKLFREAQKAQRMGKDSAHPITGDLSRFMSTAGRDRRGG